MGPVWNSTSLLGENRYRGKDSAEIIAHNVGWSDFLRFSKTGNFHCKQLNILKLDLIITVLDSYVVVVVGVMLRILLCVCVCRRRSSQVLSPPGPGGTPPLGTGGRQGIGGGHIQCLRSRYEGSAPAQLKKNKFLIKLFYSFVPTSNID